MMIPLYSNFLINFFEFNQYIVIVKPKVLDQYAVSTNLIKIRSMIRSLRSLINDLTKNPVWSREYLANQKTAYALA